MSTTIDATVPKTAEHFVDVRNKNMSSVLQEVQDALKGPITRPVLNDVTRKLQRLITDDLKVQSEEWQAELPAPTQFSRRGDRTADKYYRDTCAEFAQERMVQLHRMYAKTAAVLHDAMSDTTAANLEKNGKTKTYFASEMSEKVDSFKLAVKHICDGEVLPSLPGVPDDLTAATPVSRAQACAFSGPRADMGGMRGLLTEHGASMHERLEALKHLGAQASHNTEFGSFYTYSCPVSVMNYTSYLNSKPRNFDATVNWNAGDGNLAAALKRIAGDDLYWGIMYTGSDGKEYNSLLFLQANLQDDIKNADAKRMKRIELHIYFNPYG